MQTRATYATLTTARLRRLPTTHSIRVLAHSENVSIDSQRSPSVGLQTKQVRKVDRNSTYLVHLLSASFCGRFRLRGFVQGAGHNTLPFLNREKAVNRWDDYLFHQSARPMNLNSIHLGRIPNPEVWPLIVGRLITATT